MILCFSGTGNSRYIAERIAEALQDEIVDLNAKIKAADYAPIQAGATSAFRTTSRRKSHLPMRGVSRKSCLRGLLKRSCFRQSASGL